MREKAASLPNVRLEQGTVTSLLEENGNVKGVNYKTRNGEELTAHAPLTVVCDGCFSNFQRSLCSSKVDSPSCFVAMALENCELPHANHGHVILADPSPILFYPISSNESKNEYLNPFNCFSSLKRRLERASLCNDASNEVSSKHLPLLSGLSTLIAGAQPNAGKFMNANFLPPIANQAFHGLLLENGYPN
ncbi:hypothetical protein JCGZ_16392 [Jatropha curcas]|uniref:Squalene monooxygenase n=1 Tax=Jatropha curcas TaxID=180498 RepID=A0A067LJT5_JATCU|nr:hypothetical protein JCGZ_16392 [Jatropha curcas]